MEVNKRSKYDFGCEGFSKEFAGIELNKEEVKAAAAKYQVPMVELFRRGIVEEANIYELQNTYNLEEVADLLNMLDGEDGWYSTEKGHCEYKAEDGHINQYWVYKGFRVN